MKISDTIIGSIIIGVLVGGAISLQVVVIKTENMLK